MVVRSVVSSAGEDGAMTSHGADSHESTLDMTDVMDISCDPPGPSSVRAMSSASPAMSRVSSRPSSHVGEEVQAVTTRLHQVAVTHPDSLRSSPLNQRTSSLEDSRALTSSAEELSSTLVSNFKVDDPSDSVWVPIDRPPMRSVSQSPEFIQVRRKPEEPVVKRTTPTPKSSGKMVTSYTKQADNKESVVFVTEDDLYKKESMSSSSKSSSLPDNEPSSLGDSMSSSKNSGKSVDDGKSSSSSSLSSSKKGSVHVKSEKKIPDLIQDEREKEEKEKEEFRPSETVTATSVWSRGSPFESSVATKASSPPREEEQALEEFSSSKVMKTSATESTTVTTEMSWKPKNKTKKPPSTTTSEDDLWSTTESKKDKKKKKKKTKTTSEEENEAPLDVQPASVVTSSFKDTHRIQDSEEWKDTQVEPKEDNKDTFNTKTNPDAVHMDIDIEADYFHAAEEYHEPGEKMDEFVDFKKECFQEPQAEKYEEAQDSVVQNLEDFEFTNEEEAVPKEQSQESMLRSMHDDNDLAKALEEAYSSDDNTPVPTKARTRTHSRSRPSRASEMFPFKEDTSDDEEEVRLRRRVVVSATITCSTSRSSGADETSTDERGETSDDRGESSTDDRRTATSESDVAASPNPRATSTSKKKKKKRR